MNMEKKYIDEKIWVVENFLTQEELDWFKPWIDDANDWYVTMRSPYKNIMNKFLGVVPEHDENGNIVFPHEKSKIIDHKIFSKVAESVDDGGIWQRLSYILPKHYKPHNTLQSFKYMTDEEININLNKSMIEEYQWDLNNIDFAMQWHQDPGEESNVNASFSLYLNDDYEGGELEFEKNSMVVKPKSGMLIVIPGGNEYRHKVRKLLGPTNRHTLYGNSWNDLDNVPVSTGENC